MRRFIAVAVTAAALLAASGLQADDDGRSRYARALDEYSAGQYARAAADFQLLYDEGAYNPETVKARYFRARSLMQLKQWDEASKELVQIYVLSKPFYNEWACDFLLGECRRAMGKA